jgi:uncharacterized membrane protein YfcA
MEISPEVLTIFAAIFSVAGFVKGVIGFGLPTISIGLLGLLIAPDQAAAILIVPTFLTNVWQAFVGSHTLAVLRRLWPMLAGVFLGTLMTAGIITGADPRLAATFIGIMLVIYAALGLFGFRLLVSRSTEIVGGPAAGLTTGLINGATAIFILPGTLYMQAIELSKGELIQGLGFLALSASSALALGFGLNGAGHTSLWPVVLIALTAAIVGMLVGQSVRGKLSVSLFRRWTFIGLVAIGAAMILRGLPSLEQAAVSYL